MLHVLALHGVGGEIYRANVVTLDECGACEGAMELLEQLTESGRLGHVVGHSSILDLNT